MNLAVLVVAVVPAGPLVSNSTSLPGTPRTCGAPFDPRLGEGLRLDEEKAQAEFEKAEALIEKGQYEKARKLFEKIAEKYPDTEAGLKAHQRSVDNQLLGWSELIGHGPSENRVVIVLMGDGYPVKKLKNFDDLAGDVPRNFERDSVFGEYYSYLNFVKASVVSEEDGIDGYGREASTALGGRMIEGDVFDQVTVDRFAVSAILEQIPDQDGFAIVFVPKGELGTGGNGVAAIGGGKPDPTVVMRMWGHAFGALKDEFTDHAGYQGEVTSWINVSDKEDPAEVPWAHWIEAKVTGIGVYEGADGRVRGAWKPTSSGCRMEGGEFFCEVCREALLLAVYELVDPIDESVPEPSDDSYSASQEFEVTVLQPTSHELEVDWYVLPEESAPTQTGDPLERPRRKRGPLERIEAKPTESTRGKKGVHTFEAPAKGLAPGRYRVICRVRDTTKLRGDRWPWVLKDDHGVLESERGWWIEIAE